MPMPVRLVCACCLESVESSSTEGMGRPPRCPSCGSQLELGALATRADATAEHVTPYGSPTLEDEPTRDDDEDRPKGRIGRFVLRERLGGGGYGDVYNAFDPRLEREVALKILKVTKLDAKATQRFLREARAAAKLSHANIVALHDAGQDDGRLWIAYQIIEGRPLSRLLDSRSMDLPAAVKLVRDLADALRHAHGRGIYHRDIKPANVIIDEDGVPHLTDFGLARRVDLDSELTGEGTILGTPAYMSPEQAAGRAHMADGRSDIYSLGVILYELICGRRPSDYPSNTPFWKLDHRTPPPAPHTLDRAIPHTLDRICMKALALDAAQRYQDAGALVRALDEWLGRGAVSRPRKRALAVLLVLGICSASAALVLRPARLGGHGPTKVPGDGGIVETLKHEVRRPVSPPALGDPTKEPDGAGVLVNKKNRVIHLRPDHCSAVSQMHEGNGRRFMSRKEAEDAGYMKICETCNKK
jgi:hypothetical protein